ncbi:MAG: DNA-directed RNA polymerase subunit omega [Firmicutes bacterium]|nr:DNA-directed RNA polymerase subunit omega [Bacillota bacterium]
MLYPKIDVAIGEIGDKYSAVIVAARRGRDVLATLPAELARLKMSELSYALKEINEGRITVIRGAVA